MQGESADPKRVKKNEESVDVASVLLAREKRRDTIEHIFTLKRITAAGTRLVVPIHLRVGIDDLSSPRQLLYQLSARGTSSSSASSSLMSPWSMLAAGVSRDIQECNADGKMNAVQGHLSRVC